MIAAFSSELPIMGLENIEYLPLPRKSVSEYGVYNCQYCNKSFGKYHSRRRHEFHYCFLNPQAHQQKKRNLFTCEVCGASYTRKVHLKSHEKDDCGKVHQCGNCGRIYSEKSGLRRHLRTVKCTPCDSLVTQ